MQTPTQTSDYTATISVEKTPMEVFNAINNVRGWWSGQYEGITDKIGAEFTYEIPGTHRSKQKITELIPGKKIAWVVKDAWLGFVKDKTEWNGTEMIFDIAKKGDKTEIRFTHKGLNPADECYDSCSNAWGVLISGNLRNLIISGKDQPSPW